jgi:diguanylate cyclase (GGDEF)-like protein/PAS domain S-box-containing protein
MPVDRSKILIVDDMPANVQVLGSALKTDYDVHFATSGEKALALIERYRPDLVLLDVMMPGMSGHEVHRRLRAVPHTRDIPVIFVTADTSEDSEAAGLTQGADDYVVKPIVVPLLLARIRNLLERNRLRRELERREARLATLIASLQDCVIMLDATGRIDLIHAPSGSFLESSAPQLLDREFSEHLPPELVRVFEAELDRVRRARSPGTSEFALPLGGMQRFFQITVNGLADSAEDSTGFLAVIRDITDRKRAEEEIRNLAFYDPLTGLPNRRLLLDRLRLAFAASARDQRQGALIFIDLDNFKRLNDTFGHDRGDLLLIEVARRLRLCVRENDTVARLGGDEFVVMLEDLHLLAEEAARQAGRVGEKILAALNRGYTLAGQEHHSTPSLGICLFQGSGTGIDDLLKRADLAMYEAKASGRNTMRFFDPVMQAAMAEHAEWTAALSEALRNGDFGLHYQPQVDRHGHLYGAEALVRWLHPERGVILPARFLTLAEETGLILSLGLRVLEMACIQLADWQRHAETERLTVAVNISPRQFLHPEFVDQVRATLQRTGARPSALVLELTENLLLRDMESAVEKMNVLRTLGVRFSIDDFGTGCTSLAHLKRLPLAQVKIDQSFVRNLLSDPGDVLIVRAVIALGRSLGLRVIAEGVETEGQRAVLQAEHCDEFQGYVYGRPMPVEQFIALVKSWPLLRV